MQKHDIPKDLKFILLAAGYGSRWDPLSKVIHKACLPFLNIPFIEFIICYLRYWDIRNVYINLYHLGHSISELLSESSHDCKFHFSIEPELLGTAGGVRKIFSSFGESSALVMNSDSFSPIPFSRLCQYHFSNNSEITLCVKMAKKSLPFTKIFLNANNRMSFEPASNTGKCHFFFTGYYILNSSFLNHLPDDCYADMAKDLVMSPEYCEKIKAYVLNKWWIDIGTPQNYLSATRYILSKLSKNDYKMPWLPDNLIAQQTLTINKKTAVLAGKKTKILSTLLHEVNVVGNQCTIAENAYIKNCVFFEKSYAAPYTELTHCIVGPFVNIPANAHYDSKMVISKPWLSHHCSLPAESLYQEDGENMLIDIR